MEDDVVTEELIAKALLNHRGFGFYTDPMEGGQDAYDLTMEAMDEAMTIMGAIKLARKEKQNRPS